MRNKILSIVLLSILFFTSLTSSANAQLAAYAEITTPQLQTFPELVFYMDAFDGEGVFLSGLKKEEISLLENGGNITPDKVSELSTPLNFILAINSSPSLANRDAFAVTRYEKVLTHLLKWTDTLGESVQDKFAITWNGGAIGTDMDRASWKDRISNFDINARASVGSVDGLGYAIELAEKMPSEPGIKRSILFISGRLSVEEQEALRPLISRAAADQVRVFVIVTDARDYETLPSVTSLYDLAASTGGRSFFFSGDEELPALEQWFATLRKVYQITYTSQIHEGGSQSLSVQIDHNDLILSSNLVNFSMDLQAPSVTLLSPPSEIVRDDPNNGFDMANYQPKTVEIQALIEFPDGRQRAITRSALLVDGAVVVENLEAPFDRFNWDVSDIIASADHRVSVTIEDAYGFTNSSTEVPVLVTVVPPFGGIFSIILTNKLASALALISLLLFIALIIVSRRKAKLIKRSLEKPEPTVEVKKEEEPKPSTPEPSPIEEKPDPMEGVELNNFDAWLIPVNEEDKVTDGAKVSIMAVPFTIGAAEGNSLVLNDRSVAKEHAVIERDVDGTFTVSDTKTLTGTWVDHQSVHGKGKTLSNGNLLHFGRVGYRYEDNKGSK